MKVRGEGRCLVFTTDNGRELSRVRVKDYDTLNRKLVELDRESELDSEPEHPWVETLSRWSFDETHINEGINPDHRYLVVDFARGTYQTCDELLPFLSNVYLEDEDCLALADGPLDVRVYFRHTPLTGYKVTPKTTLALTLEEEDGT